jgi:hypothetical protein
MGQHQGVVVGVHNLAVGGYLLGDLVGVDQRGQARPDVEELADTGLGGQVPHHPGQKRAVRPRAGDHLGAFPHYLLRCDAVGGEVVLPAEPVPVDPGRVRHAGVQAAGRITAGGLTA